MTSPGETDQEDPETEAQAVESEWHVWLAGLIVVGGIALMVAPDWLVPELLAGLGPLFLALGIIGWAAQWVYKRWRRADRSSPASSTDRRS